MIVLELGEEKNISLDKEEKEELKKLLESFVESQDPKSYHFNFQKIESSISNGSDLYHVNYLDYLNHSWSKHYGVVFSPDICWYTILYELTRHIKVNRLFYESYFQKLHSTNELKVFKEDNTKKIPFHRIRKRLKNIISLDIELFLPEFSTSDASSINAFALTFFESMGSYFKFRNVGCGIPKVLISGTRQDWEDILFRVDGFSKLFSRAYDHFNRIKDVIEQIIRSFDSPDKDFWKNIFKSNQCGQGKSIDGWITNLYNYNFIDRPSFPNHISSLYYTGEDKRDRFRLSYGVFQSRFNDHGFLEPQFGYILYNLTKRVYKPIKNLEYKPEKNDDNDDGDMFGQSIWGWPNIM